MVAILHRAGLDLTFSSEVRRSSFLLWTSAPITAESVPSTQDAVKDPSFPHFTPFLALHQERGRGRRGNRWYSPRGKGLYLSFKVPKDFFKTADLSPVSLAVGYAVSETVDAYALSKIKWPNDVYLNGKKVAGILVEATPRDIVVGIGVNLNTESFPEELKPFATSIYRETQQRVDRSEFTELLLLNLSDALLEFREKGFTPFVERINRKLLWRNQRVVIDGKECGKLLGVDEKGRAVVLTCFKQLKRLPYGEISIRKK